MAESNDQSSADALRREGEDTARHARERAHGIADEARAEGERLAGRARDEAEGAKRGAADEASRVARALRRAGEEFESGSIQYRVFRDIADGVDSTADTVRGRDIDDLAGDVSSFARRQPALFLGGAALLGFAVSRFANATERRRHTDRLDAQIAEHHPVGSAPAEPVSPTEPGPRQHTDPL